MRRRLACSLLSAAGCLLLLGPWPPPPPDRLQQPLNAPTQRHLRHVEAFSAAAAHKSALLPPCPQPEEVRVPPPGADTSRITVLRAYEDLRVEELPAVRVLATIDGPQPPPQIFCQVLVPGRPIAASRATLTEIWWSSWDSGRQNSTLVRPFLLTCPFTRDSPLPPERVTLAENSPCQPSTLQLPVSPFPKGENIPQRSVAVCVKGLDFPEDEDFSLRLLEWVEANRLLGASHFHLYLRRTPHPNVRKILSHLRSRGGVDARPSVRALDAKRLDLWQRRRLDVLDLTDCLYRSVGRFEFVLSIDIDEVMLPVAGSTWQKILSRLSDEATQYASLSVQNYFFFSGQSASILDVTWRSANVTVDAVKSFVPTANALTLFNHYALHTLVSGVLPRYFVDLSLAQVNHYRRECPVLLGQDCESMYLRFGQRDNLLKDRIGQTLRKNVDRFRKIFKIPMKDKKSWT